MMYLLTLLAFILLIQAKSLPQAVARSSSAQAQAQVYTVYVQASGKQANWGAFDPSYMILNSTAGQGPQGVYCIFNQLDRAHTYFVNQVITVTLAGNDRNWLGVAVVNQNQANHPCSSVPGSFEVTIYDLATRSPRSSDFSVALFFNTNYNNNNNKLF